MAYTAVKDLQNIFQHYTLLGLVMIHINAIEVDILAFSVKSEFSIKIMQFSEKNLKLNLLFYFQN
jgi:hypothetical protein